MTLEVKPEVAAALEALASARGLSIEEYLELLVERESPAVPENQSGSEGTGMVSEGGLLVYRSGRPLPASVIDNAVRELREERAKRVLGNRS